MERRSKRPIGELLVAEELITQGELLDALANRTVVDGRRERLGETIIRLGFVDGRDMARVVAKQFDLEYVGDDLPVPDRALAERVAEDVARSHGVVPLRVEDDGTMVVLTADPSESAATDAVGEAAQASALTILVGATDQVTWAMEVLYGDADPGAQPLGGSLGGTAEAATSAAPHHDHAHAPVEHGADVHDPSHAAAHGADVPSSTDVPAVDAPAPAVTAVVAGPATASPAHGPVDALLRGALHTGATAVHLDRRPEGWLVRHRVDGVLRPAHPPADVDIAEVHDALRRATGMPARPDRTPRTGQAVVSVDGAPVALQVTTLPGLHGESVVVGLTRHHAAVPDLTSLELDAATQARLEAALRQPGGLVLIGGPTGSGRTTTLRAVLGHLADGTRGAALVATSPLPPTAEVTQLLAGSGAAVAGLADAAVQADVDVLAIDGLGDAAAALVAVRAARAGRLVIATLDAADAADAVQRLHRLAGDADAPADLVRLAIGVRLGRRVCQGCRVDHTPTEEERAGLDLLPDVQAGYVHGTGCDACAGTGHDGRLPLVEVLVVEGDVRRAALQGSPDHIRAAARRAGSPSVRQIALGRAQGGATSLDDVLRHTPADRTDLAVTGLADAGAGASAAGGPAQAPAAGLPLPRRTPGREDASAAAGMFSAARTQMADQVLDHDEPPPRIDPEQAVADARARLEEMLQGVE